MLSQEEEERMLYQEEEERMLFQEEEERMLSQEEEERMLSQEEEEGPPVWRRCPGRGSCHSGSPRGDASCESGEGGKEPALYII